MNCRFFTWETAIQIKGTLLSLSLPLYSISFSWHISELKKKKRKEKICPEKGEGGHGLSSKEFTHCLDSLILQFCCHKHVPVWVLTELPSSPAP